MGIAGSAGVPSSRASCCGPVWVPIGAGGVESSLGSGDDLEAGSGGSFATSVGEVGPCSGDDIFSLCRLEPHLGIARDPGSGGSVGKSRPPPEVLPAWGWPGWSGCWSGGWSGGRSGSPRGVVGARMWERWESLGPPWFERLERRGTPAGFGGVKERRDPTELPEWRGLGSGDREPEFRGSESPGDPLELREFLGPAFEGSSRRCLPFCDPLDRPDDLPDCRWFSSPDKTFVGSIKSDILGLPNSELRGVFERRGKDV